MEEACAVPRSSTKVWRHCEICQCVQADFSVSGYLQGGVLRYRKIVFLFGEMPDVLHGRLRLVALLLSALYSYVQVFSIEGLYRGFSR